MTRILNIAEAKAHLSELVASAAAGEDIIIARAGKPMVRLVHIEPTRRGKRPKGIWPQVVTPDESLIGPMDPENQAAIEGALSDDYGMSLKQS